jgi:hypothetical protein
VVADAAEAGGIVVHAADDPERLFAEAGIDGALPEPAIGVTWQNAAANKLDVYMHTAIAYRQPGETDGCVVFTMRNDAPEGLPDVVAGVGEVVPPRWQRSWISIYSPTAVRTVWLDGEESEFSSEVEHGSFVVALFVDVGPGQVTEVIARLQSGAPGSAMVRVQPASLPTEVTVLTQDECEGDPP